MKLNVLQAPPSQSEINNEIHKINRLWGILLIIGIPFTLCGFSILYRYFMIGDSFPLLGLLMLFSGIFILVADFYNKLDSIRRVSKHLSSKSSTDCP